MVGQNLFKRRRLGSVSDALQRYAKGSYIQTFKANTGRRMYDVGSATSAPVTNQYDVKNMYTRRRRRRRGGRRKFRRARRFAQSVQRVIQRQMGLKVQTFVANFADAPTSTTQGFKGFMLGGAAGLANVSNDLNVIYTLEYTTPASVVTSVLSFKSMVMDIEVVNTHATVTIVVDAYYVYVKHHVQESGFGSLDQAFATSVAQMGLITGGTPLNPNQPGVTPWDASDFGSAYTIYRKQRLVLSPGQVASFLLKSNRVMNIEGNNVVNMFQLKGQKGLLFVYSGVSTGAGVPASSIGFNTSRSYHYYQNTQSTEAAAQH